MLSLLSLGDAIDAAGDFIPELRRKLVERDGVSSTTSWSKPVDKARHVICWSTSRSVTASGCIR